MIMDFVGPRVCVNKGKMKTLQKRKAHSAFGTSLATKVALSMFLLVTLATNIKCPEHRINPNATFIEQVMNRFQEGNRLYVGTLDKVHHLFYATDISTNKIFIF